MSPLLHDGALMAPSTHSTKAVVRGTQPKPSSDHSTTASWQGDKEQPLPAAAATWVAGGFKEDAEHLLVSSCSSFRIHALGGVKPKLASAQQTSVKSWADNLTGGGCDERGIIS